VMFNLALAQQQQGEKAQAGKAFQAALNLAQQIGAKDIVRKIDQYLAMSSLGQAAA
jgi:hypothetical protein